MKQIYKTILLGTIVLLSAMCSSPNKKEAESKLNEPVTINTQDIPAEQIPVLKKMLKVGDNQEVNESGLQEMQNFLAEKLLENSTPWGIDFRSNYFWNIYNALPSFVSAKERHTGYNQGARDHTNLEQLMAYSIYRIDRSSKSIRNIFEFVKPALKRIVSQLEYSSWGVEVYVNEAIESYTQIVNIPNYSKLLQNAYAQADTTTGSFVWEGKSRHFRSFEDSAYGFTVDELNQIVSHHLKIDKHNSLATSPWLSFWMRRNHEGNINTVFEILSEIKRMYTSAGGTEKHTETQDIKVTYGQEVAHFAHKGKIVHFEKWNDKNGDNVLILSELRQEVFSDEGPSDITIELFAYHYANTGNGYNLIKAVTNSQSDCIFQNRARFIEEAVTITDVDKNGYSEITIVYTLGCSSELSPDELTLVAMENGTIYTINGSTIVEFDNTKLGGETHISEEFNKAPKQLLAHAKKVWENQQMLHHSWENPRKYLLSVLKNHELLNLFGVEPSWYVTINSEKICVQLPHKGDTSVCYKIREIQQIAGEFIITAYSEKLNEYVTLTFKEEPCSDGMSDDTNPVKSTLWIDGDTLDGCGNWPK